MINTVAPSKSYAWSGKKTAVPVTITSLLDDEGNILYITPTATPRSGGDPVVPTYTVGGRVMFLDEIPPVDGGYILTLTRTLPFTQLVNLAAEGNRKNLKLLEEMVDRLTLLLYQVLEPAERALTVSPGDSATDPLPVVGARAGRYVAFDSAGDVIAVLGTVEQAISDWLDAEGLEDFTPLATPDRRMRRDSSGGAAVVAAESTDLIVQENGILNDPKLVVKGDLTVPNVSAGSIPPLFGSPAKILQAYVEDYGGLYESWSARTPAVDNAWHGIAWSPELGLFAAVAINGTGNRVMTSPDGINWTTRTTNNNNWVAIAWSPELGLFAAVAYSGTGNRVMTSPDGINWTPGTSAADIFWFGIAWSPELGLFAAVAVSGSGDRVMTSPDGINWTTQTSAADNAWRAIAWSPELGLFAAVADSGTNNRVMTSPDGINWTTRLSATDNFWYGIAWSPELGLFAAVASTGSGDRVMTSPDGITWTTRTSPVDNNWRSIDWSPELGLFAAVASTGTNNRVMTSESYK